MSEYEVLFYEVKDGRCPVQDFLDNLNLKARAKAAKWLELLEREGPNLPRPYADIIRGKIRELRVIFGGQHYRFLYFFHGKKIVVTNGFTKKTSAVPEEEIVRALRAMADFTSG